jgi:hypothetical protein
MSSSGTQAVPALPDIPLEDGATGTLNVAIYFQDGFSPSEYLRFTW